MEILSTTITELNKLVESTGLFDKIYGLCKITKDATPKSVQQITEYQSSGQGSLITNYDNVNGTLAWLMRSPVTVSIAPVVNKVTSNDEVISINYPLRGIAVVKKDQLLCDNSTTGDQIAQVLLKALQGQNTAIKKLLSARSFRVNVVSYNTDVKELVRLETYATIQFDINVVIITSKDCLPSLCGESSASPCIFDIDLVNSEGLIVYSITQDSDNPFILADQPIVDGNGNPINIPYDPETPYVTEACSVVCADATVNVNGNLFDTVASGGTLNVPVEYENGTPVGSISGGIVEIPNPITCADATAVLKDTDGNILLTESIPSNVSLQLDAPDGSVTVNSVAFDTVPSDGSLNIGVRQESGSTQVGSKQGQFWRIDDSDISINSTPFDSVAAEDSLNIAVKDTNGTSVGSEVAGEWIVPAFEQDLVTRVNFDSGSALEYTITIDSDTAGTYSAASFGGSVTSATYEKNSVAASLPITVVATDTLKIIPDSDDGFVKLTGTY